MIGPDAGRKARTPPVRPDARRQALFKINILKELLYFRLATRPCFARFKKEIFLFGDFRVTSMAVNFYGVIGGKTKTTRPHTQRER